MATYTEHYNLKKPQPSEYYAIADFNGNADVIDTELFNKVDKVSGKGLSSNDYTNADKSIVDGVTSALAGKQDTLTFDNVPTQSSNNPVKSGGVKTYVDNAVSQLNDEIATKQNTLTIVDISSQATIDTTKVQDFKAYTYGKLIYIHLTLKPGVTDQSNVVTNLPYIIHGNYGVLPMFYMNDVDADSNGVCVYIDRTIQYRGSTTQGTGGTQYSSMFFIV